MTVRAGALTIASVFALLGMSTADAGSAGSGSCRTDRVGAAADLIPASAIAAQVTVGTAAPATAHRPARSAALAQTGGARPDAEWVEVASLVRRIEIRPGERAVVRFDRVGRRLDVVAPEDPLQPASHAAVERAPTWLAEPLAHNLGLMSARLQEIYAQLVLDAPDPIVDEVAFQVARMSKTSLADQRLDPQLLVDNARLMYEHDRLLKYVEIVDVGSAAAGGDYYSTTRYRVTDQAGTVTAVQIPRDMYYWYVVHPRLSDETVKASAENSDRQATYGHFWREYLFANPDPNRDYTLGPDGTSIYWKLGTVLQVPTVLWDGKTVDLPCGRPFSASDTALDVVGNWVSSVLPQRASGNRPVQPNQIAFEHNGNCGEIQDLLGAASRTGLIPNVLTSNHCEDHVWNEVFTAFPADDWLPYQVDWACGPTRIDNHSIAYDKDVGGSKDDSGIWAWRPDGLVTDIVERYTKFCTVVVNVIDSAGRPVDGAQAMLYNEAWSGSGYSPATFAHTDASGSAVMRVGDIQNYWLRVTSSLGNYPPEPNRIVPIIAASEADKTYTITATLAGTLPGHEWSEVMPADGAYRLHVRYAATDEVVAGSSPFGAGLDFADWRSEGQIDFFAFDAANYLRFDAGSAAVAAAGSEDSAGGEETIPAGDGDDDRFLVFSNEGHVANAQLVTVEIALQRSTSLTWPPAYLPAVRRGVGP